MGEHLPCKQGVKSSSLFISTIRRRPDLFLVTFLLLEAVSGKPDMSLVTLRVTGDAAAYLSDMQEHLENCIMTTPKRR